MNVGDRVKVKATGERGWVIEYDAGWSFQWIVNLDDGGGRRFNAEELEPVNITVLEGEVYAMDDFADTCAKIGDVDLVKMLEAMMGKRVRITIEELEEG